MITTSSYLTLAGNEHGKMPRFTALERARAAHVIGIPSIGVLWNEPLDLEILRYVTVPEAEWFDLSEPLTLEKRAALMTLADWYGVTMIKAGVCDASTPPWEAAANLAQLVTEAERRGGLVVAVEPVAWGSVPSLSGVISMMESAGVADNHHAGVCYDLWQIQRGTVPGNMLPEMSIAKVEVSGVTCPEPDDLISDAMNRPLVSDSEVDIPRWLNQIQDRGFTGPVTYEVPNAELRNLSLMDAALATAKDMEMIGG